MPPVRGRSSLGGAGVSQRPPGRVQVFGPEFNPSVELGAGDLGPRLTRFSQDVASAIAELGDAIDAVDGRIAGVGASQRALVEDASRAMGELLLQARNEIGAQSASLSVLRGDAIQEAAAVRHTMGEMREGMDVLYSDTKGGPLTFRAPLPSSMAGRASASSRSR